MTMATVEPIKCPRVSVMYVRYGQQGTGGAYSGGWCVCAEHAYQLFRDLAPKMKHGASGANMHFTVRAIIPGESIMMTAHGEKFRAYCQYKTERTDL